MKIVNWNLEWMNDWFSGRSAPQWGRINEGATRTSRRRMYPSEARACAAKAARVINALQPDLLCLQEGPSAEAEMALFIQDFLSDANGPMYEFMIGADGRSQKLYVLRRIDGAVAAMERAIDLPTLALADDWDADTNGDMLLEGYDFTRLPLVVDVDPIGGQPIRVVVLHTKSKYVDRGRTLWRDPNRRQEFVVQALEARRRISAEGFRLRGYLDELIAADGDARIVVTGDWNDGPGRDLFERSYLTHNVADIVLGSTFQPDLIFGHPLVWYVPTPALFTARFDDFVDEVPDRPLLLDHFAVSPALRDYVPEAGIAHDAWEAELDGSGRARTERASDHRPIWIEVSAPLTG